MGTDVARPLPKCTASIPVPDFQNFLPLRVSWRSTSRGAIHSMISSLPGSIFGPHGWTAAKPTKTREHHADFQDQAAGFGQLVPESLHRVHEDEGRVGFHRVRVRQP